MRNALDLVDAMLASGATVATTATALVMVLTPGELCGILDDGTHGSTYEDFGDAFCAALVVAAHEWAKGPQCAAYEDYCSRLRLYVA